MSEHIDPEATETISWAEIIGERKELPGVATLAGKPVNIWYCPNKVNEEFFEAADALQSLEQDSYKVAQHVAPIFQKIGLGWNIVDDDGKQIPLDVPTLRQIKSEALIGIVKAVLDSLSVDPTSSPKSDAT